MSEIDFKSSYLILKVLALINQLKTLTRASSLHISFQLALSTFPRYSIYDVLSGLTDGCFRIFEVKNKSKKK